MESGQGRDVDKKASDDKTVYLVLSWGAHGADSLEEAPNLDLVGADRAEKVLCLWLAPEGRGVLPR